jgi:hypothetical protein
MLAVSERLGKLRLASKSFSKMFANSQHSTRPGSERQSHTVSCAELSFRKSVEQIIR